MKVVDYIPQPEPHEVQSEDSDSNVDSDVGSCSKPASTTVEKELSEKEKEKMLKLKLPLKINTESFYGDSTPNCATQTSPMPPSPKLPRVLDPSPVSLSDKPNSVGKTSESLPPVSTESASPSAVSNIWKAAKLSKDAVTSGNTNSSNGAAESDRKSITDKGVKTTVSAVNGESNGSVGDSSSKDGSSSNGKGYRHRPDPLWRSVHSDGNHMTLLPFLPLLLPSFYLLSLHLPPLLLSLLFFPSFLTFMSFSYKWQHNLSLTLSLLPFNLPLRRLCPIRICG